MERVAKGSLIAVSPGGASLALCADDFILLHGTPIPTVAKRLGHANANVTLSIYAHALEADEMAAAKIWDDAMADVISAGRTTTGKSAQNLAKSSAKPHVYPEVVANKSEKLERATGIEPVWVAWKATAQPLGHARLT